MITLTRHISEKLKVSTNTVEFKAKPYDKRDSITYSNFMSDMDFKSYFKSRCENQVAAVDFRNVYDNTRIWGYGIYDDDADTKIIGIDPDKNPLPYIEIYNIIINYYIDKGVLDINNKFIKMYNENE
jgi:hypothetical protein